MYTPEKKYIEPVIVTSNGVVKNKYSMEIPNILTQNQLFTP